MLIRTPHNPGPYDDDWEDQPAQGPFYQWGLGAGLPLLLISYGLKALHDHTIQMGSGSNSMTLNGPNATAYGIAVIAAGIFVHCHYFWGNLYNQIWFAVLGKILSAMGFIGGLVYLLIHFGIYGSNH